MKILIDGIIDEKNNIYTSEALNFGYGLFETIKLESGKLFFLKEHIDRLNRSLKYIGINDSLNIVDIEKKVKELPDFDRIEKGAVKILVAKSKDDLICIISSRKAEYKDSLYENGFKLKISKVFRNESSIMPKIKSINYLENIIERQKAIEDNYDDCLFLNSKNRIAETSIANVFFVKNGNIYTPDIEEGLLEGVLRNIVIEISRNSGIKIYEGKYDLEEIYNADEVFITNSLMGIMPISCIDEKKYSMSNSKVTRKLSCEYKKIIEGE